MRLHIGDHEGGGKEHHTFGSKTDSSACPNALRKTPPSACGVVGNDNFMLIFPLAETGKSFTM